MPAAATRPRPIPRRLAEHRSISAHGLGFILREEGCVLAPYRDSRGWVTYGVGHLAQPAHQTISKLDRARAPRTRTAAMELLRRDLHIYEQAVRHALRGVQVSHAEYDMCVSLCFNIGTAGFARSSVAQHLRNHHRRAAADAFLLWANPPELRGRRLRERARFLAARW